MRSPAGDRSRPETGWKRRLAATGAAVALVATAGLAGLPAAEAAPVPDGWSTVWSDDFNGAAGSLPGSDWQIDTGTSYPGGPPAWGTWEVQTYTDSTANLYTDGKGNLNIKPLRDASGKWTSARIETKRSNFKPAAGAVLAIESRIQMPNVTGDKALGYWPAFWALGSPYRGNWWNWPGIGELDIMENVNGMDRVWAVLHCGVNPGGPCNESTGIAGYRACPGSSCQSAFHTYRFEWDRSKTPNELRWYVDGQQFHSVSQTQVPADTWTSMTQHEGYYILLNVAMGGAFPNALAGETPTAATEPGHPMVIDYVAVQTKGGGTDPGDPDPTPTPTPTEEPTEEPTSTPTATPTEEPTTEPTGNPSGSAYRTIEAEDASNAKGATIGSSAVTGLGNGDWLKFSGLDFGSTAANQFTAKVASGASGGVSGLVEVRLDSPTGAVLGSFAVANTGGWTSWRSIPANIAGAKGVHDVYITFTSGQPADFVAIDNFSFGRPGGAEPTVEPTPTPTPTSTATSDPGGSAYGTIQAEAASASKGATIGSSSVTGLGNSDWLKYSGLDFGSTAANQFTAKVASGASGGVSGLVEVRLDSPTGAVLGSFAVANTGGWTSWRSIPANIAGAKGVHDVYITFTSGQPADFVAIDSFTFAR